MTDLLKYLEQLGLSPATLILILIVVAISREIWAYFRMKRLQELATIDDKYFSRVQTYLTDRYEKICILRGMVEDFHHFSMRVAEGLGRDVRHSEPKTYCDHLTDRYWEIRDFARRHSQLLGDDIQSAAITLTDAGKPLLDDCSGKADIGFSASSDAARRVIRATKRTRDLFDREAVQLEQPRRAAREHL